MSKYIRWLRTVPGQALAFSGCGPIKKDKVEQVSDVECAKAVAAGLARRLTHAELKTSAEVQASIDARFILDDEPSKDVIAAHVASVLAQQGPDDKPEKEPPKKKELATKESDKKGGE